MRNPKTVLAKTIKNPVYRPDINRPGFVEPDVLGRAIDFNQLALLKLENEGPTVSLSEGTLKKIFETEIPDPSDTTYNKENRPQRKIKKTMNLADTAVSLSDKIMALKAVLQQQLITTPSDEIALRTMIESILNSNEELIRVMKVREAAQVLQEAINAAKMGPTPESEALSQYYTLYEWRDVSASDPLRLYVISKAQFTANNIPYISKIVSNNATPISITDIAFQNPSKWVLDLSIPAIRPLTDAPQDVQDRAKSQGKAPAIIPSMEAEVPAEEEEEAIAPTVSMEEIETSSAYIKQLEDRLENQLDFLQSTEDQLDEARSELASKYKVHSNKFKEEIRPYMDAKKAAAKLVATTRKELKEINDKRKKGPREYEIALIKTLQKLSTTNDSILSAVKDFKDKFDKSDISRLKDVITTNNMSIRTIQQDLGQGSSSTPPPPPPPPKPLTEAQKKAAAERAKAAQQSEQLMAELKAKLEKRKGNTQGSGRKLKKSKLIKRA